MDSAQQDFVWDRKRTEYEVVKSLLLPNEEVILATCAEVRGSSFLTLTDRRLVFHNKKEIVRAAPFYCIDYIESQDEKGKEKWESFTKKVHFLDGRIKVFYKDSEKKHVPERDVYEIKCPKTGKGEEKEREEALFWKGIIALKIELAKAIEKSNDPPPVRNYEHLVSLPNHAPMNIQIAEALDFHNEICRAVGKKPIQFLVESYQVHNRKLVLQFSTEGLLLYRPAKGKMDTNVVVLKEKQKNTIEEIAYYLVTRPFGYRWDSILAITWDWNSWMAPYVNLVSSKVSEMTKHNLSSEKPQVVLGASVSFDNENKIVNMTDPKNKSELDHFVIEGVESKTSKSIPWFHNKNLLWLLADAYYYITGNPLSVSTSHPSLSKPQSPKVNYLY
ncbi:MAG: hypothetical protein ACFFF4_13940 [Candidatus Thorarchaeota archaeon]